MIMALVAMLAFGNFPATADNDGSCEIAVAPAATLLLPVFDVTLTSDTGDTTLFTITNVTPSPQIAHVTIWTDWSYPVLTFNVFLTGYDVQSINLYDVLARGEIAVSGAPRAGNDNPNISDESLVPGGFCSGSTVPGTISKELLGAVQTSLVTGLYNIAGTTTGCGTTRVGGTHINARGFVTVDVVTDCTNLLPNNPIYYQTQILFDNALIGDYQQIKPDPTVGNLAQGNPMVHIRAIPEGGPAGYVPQPGTTNLPYTFYDHYTPAGNRKMDRRVPLPSTFAARWIEGGTSSFNTTYKIWREGVAVGAETASCSSARLNSGMRIGDFIRFDERENSYGFLGNILCPIPCFDFVRTPAALIASTNTAGLFPPHSSSTDISGWMYLNLNHQTAPNARPSQSWVIVSIFSQGRYSADFDAVHLGNGCSAAAAFSSPEIGPTGGTFVCPPGIACSPPSAQDHPYNGTNITP
jgi:hypothetical protein